MGEEVAQFGTLEVLAVEQEEGRCDAVDVVGVPCQLLVVAFDQLRVGVVVEDDFEFEERL